MSVTVEIAGVEATIQDGEWSCEDELILGAILACTDRRGPEGSDPYPDLTTAMEIAQLLRGKVMRYDELPDGPPDLVI